ncbi:MAG: Nif3-like dinuclear metal center hexameric protein [Acetobacteraceae bacterium]|nr:Nif3-like dinuclear metal center hexameric protein [Acetobacteraceae bacterium]
MRFLVRYLDNLLCIDRFSAVEPFRDGLPALYGPMRSDWLSLVEAAFGRRGNGLMVAVPELEAGVEAVFLAVFPSPQVVEALISATGQRSVRLLILHHPAHYRVEAGWQPVPVKQLAALRQARVAVYAVHAPLDESERFGVSACLAGALELQVVGPLGPPDSPGLGRAGVVAAPREPLGLKEFVGRVVQALGVPYADVRRFGREEVLRVAVVGGGGHTIPDLLGLCEAAGCDTVLTGTIIERVPNPRWQRANARLLQEARRRGINLIGASHCATERYGLLALGAHLEGMGCEVRFLGCGNPWE